MLKGCPACGAVYSAEAEFCRLDGARLVEGDPMIGRRIGPYKVLASIGAGAIGAVYAAEREGEPGQKVALKVLKPDAASRRESVKRFRREAESVRKIRHEHVVSVVDSGEDGGLLYLAMELVAGKSLEQRMAEGVLGPERCAHIGRQIALGLAAAHGLGFVHRDLKPSNVMLEEGDRVKLVDFGVVGFAAEAAEITRLTKEGVTVGTPYYMAPEQMASPTVGAEADLYALGCVMFEMLSGKPPFIGPLRDVIMKHMSEPAPELPAHGGLGPLVARLLEKDPSRRPRSAAQLAIELSQIGQGLGPTRIATVPLTIQRLLLAPLRPATDSERTVEAERPQIDPDGRVTADPLPSQATTVPDRSAPDPAATPLVLPTFILSEGLVAGGATLRDKVPHRRRPALGVAAGLAAALGGVAVIGLSRFTSTPHVTVPPPLPAERSPAAALPPPAAAPEPQLEPEAAVVPEAAPASIELEAPTTPAARPRSAKPRPPPAPIEAARALELNAPASLVSVRVRLERLDTRLRAATSQLDSATHNALYLEYLEIASANEKGLSADRYQVLLGRVGQVEHKLDSALAR